jgi:ATP-binding cassette, subfamily B, bacterial
MSHLQYIRVLARYLAPYRGMVGSVVFMLMLDVAFSIAWPLSFKYFIDNISSLHMDSKDTVQVIAVLIGAVLIASLSDILRGYGYAVLSSKVKRDARQTVFRHLQQMSMSFYVRERTRNLIGHLSSDLSLLETAVTSGIANYLLGFTGIIVSTTLLFFLEWHLAALTVLGLILCVMLPRPLLGKAARARAQVEDMETELESTAQESLIAQPVVKAFGLGTHFISDFERQTESLAKQTQKSKFLTYMVERTPNGIILTVQVLVMGLGLVMVAGERTTLGTIIAFQGIFLYVIRSVQTLTQVTPVLVDSISGLGRVQELLHERPAVPEAPDALPALPMREGIRFNNVTFSYGTDQPNLDRVNFTIPCGTFAAIVGASGSGKSTLLNLLIRFYDPAHGAITFDGTDIRQASLDALRREIGVVMQEGNLFNLSLRENIRLGSPGATDRDVETAARMAEIHEWIVSQPQGYDTPAGEYGARISAGQRQRIAIARALVRQPKILILDEATTSLDPVAEAAIIATLRDLSAGRTLIFLTHRLSNVRGADCIHFMERGALLESGNHYQLLAAENAYAKLWRRQSGFTFNDSGDSCAVEARRLRDYPVLQDLEPSVLEEVARFFVAESYPAGRNVMVQGEIGDRFYLIARGRVEVVKENGSAEPQKVAILDDGDYFGELALLHRVPRTATVRTLAPSLLLSLRDTHFQALLQRQPGLKTRFHDRETPLSRSTEPAVTIATANAERV